MFIQNAVYKAVPTDGLTFPLAEGTVLTVGDVTGIVPENIALAAPTGLIYLATGGTIDLTSEANAGITFTDAELNALSGDFNFIPLAEAGGSGLPPYTSADKGKFLGLGEADPVETVIVPEQTVTVVDSSVAITGDISTLEAGDTAIFTVNGVAHEVTATVIGVSFKIDGVTYVIASTPQTGLRFYSHRSNTAVPGTYTVSLAASVPSVEPKWEVVPKPEYDAVLEVTYDMGSNTYTADRSFAEEAALDNGVTLIRVSGGLDPWDVLCTREKNIVMPGSVVTDVIYTQKNIVLELVGNQVRFDYEKFVYQSTGFNSDAESGYKYINLATD